MTQEEISQKEFRLSIKISELQTQLRDLEKERQDLYVLSTKLDDPHDLIPKSFKTIEEWIANNSNVGRDATKELMNYRYQNRAKAEMAQLACNTYQEHYHIVKPKKYEARTGNG